MMSARVSAKLGAPRPHASVQAHAKTPVAAAAAGKLSARASFGAASAFSGASLSARAGARGSLVVMANTLEAGVGIFGNKAGMTQVFTEDGKVVPVTVVSVNDGNVVTMVKTSESDGYNAVQVGYTISKEKHLTKPELGHLAKSGAPPLRHLGEFRVASVDGFEAGQKLDWAEMFSEGDLVDVQGTSIGKGFQGGIKRHGYKRGLMTHGSKSHREHGSYGPGTTPGRIYPGTKEPGQMGNVTVKERKVQIVKVDAENNCVLVKGSLPGKPGNLLRITPAKIVGKNV